MDLFRRVSPSWKEPITGFLYREGQGLHTLTYADQVLGVAICGDVWHDHFLEELKRIKMNAFLWPLYVDFSVEERYLRKCFAQLMAGRVI